MALSIKNDEVEGLARELARETGDSITQVILHALQRQAQHVRQRRAEGPAFERIMRARERCAALPDRDSRSADKILGYGADGTFD
jgi:antitoxin VapB